MKCPYCGKETIDEGIRVQSQAAGAFVSQVGLAKEGFFMTSAYMYADMCKECGTIVRLYVRDKDGNFDHRTLWG